jgi:hypothetical protein
MIIPAKGIRLNARETALVLDSSHSLLISAGDRVVVLASSSMLATIKPENRIPASAAERGDRIRF